MKVYMARPITGGDFEGVVQYYEKLSKTLLDLGYVPLSPMAGKGYLVSETNFSSSGYKHPVSMDHAIVERDRWMVGQADIVFCDLSQSKKVSIGCVMELAWASELRKHVVLVMERGNVHEHAFVFESADIVFETYSQAVIYLKNLIFGDMRSWNPESL